MGAVDKQQVLGRAQDDNPKEVHDALEQKKHGRLRPDT
jgi:hypothetical protein